MSLGCWLVRRVSYSSVTETVSTISSTLMQLAPAEQKAGKSQPWRGKTRYLECLQGQATFFRCAHTSRSALVHPRQGAITFIKPEKNDKLMEKLSGAPVCNHGHGQIVFRSSMALIIKLRTAFPSFCSLGKIDCVLKFSPLFTKAVLITILYSWTAVGCCSRL